MRVYNGATTQNVMNANQKAKSDCSYIAFVTWRETKHVYLIKREGQRSWGAFALTDIDDEMTHIKGNSTNILRKVLDQACTGVWGIIEIPNKDKTVLRKCIMEAICYGTIGDVTFNITYLK